MLFQDLKDVPSWLTTLVGLVVGAGGAKLLSVWLESRRLATKDYRDTLLGRIRELEKVIEGMQASFTQMSVELALVKDENSELRQQLADKSNAHPPGSV